MTINEKSVKDIISYRVAQANSVLNKKNSEYTHQGNRYFAFFKGADILNEYPEQTLMGYMVKHTTSVIQLMDQAEKTPDSLRRGAYDPIIDEKVGDQFNYLFILLGMLNRTQDIGVFTRSKNLVNNLTKAVEGNLDDIMRPDFEYSIKYLDTQINNYYSRYNPNSRYRPILLEDLITEVWTAIEVTMTQEVLLRKAENKDDR